MEDRNHIIDTAKGYGMILVIAGHLFTYGSYPFNFIFSFHMPLFFFLSGFLFTLEKYPNSRYLFKKIFRTMIATYLFFIIIGFFLYAVSGRLNLNEHFLYSTFLKDNQMFVVLYGLSPA
ncbi:acyltransferase family protein [Bacteroides difficilis]|uniref:acyltransferase family protein n=1 Tax=Bacteroides difficilis TaxID=2763021 RepID=UPI003AAC2F15